MKRWQFASEISTATFHGSYSGFILKKKAQLSQRGRVCLRGGGINNRPADTGTGVAPALWLLCNSCSH